MSVITSISYDHTAILGNTIEDIALQKAGIIKPKSNTVYYRQGGIADKVISNMANEMGNNLFYADTLELKPVEMNIEHTK